MRRNRWSEGRFSNSTSLLMPARGGVTVPKGQWAPQIKKGETLALKHGAWADRVVDPVAKELVGVVLAQVGYLGDPSYEPAVWAWARAEARVLVLAKWLDESGTLDEHGVPRPALAALKDFERLASTARSRLGLDPLSRAALGRDVAAQQVDLARLMSAMDDDDGKSGAN
jgi:hypothetical protein